MTNPENSDEDLESRLLRSESQMDPGTWRAHSPGKDCPSYSNLGLFAKGEALPSSAQLEHLETCLMCRTAVIVETCQAPASGHPLRGEDAWKEQLRRLPSWNSFVASVAELGPREPVRRPWRKSWRGIAAAAAILVIALPIAWFLLSREEHPFESVSIEWYLADAEGHRLGPERGADVPFPEEFQIHLALPRTAYVRLFRYDPEGRRGSIEPESGRVSVPLDPGMSEIGPYQARPPGRYDVVLLAASEPIPDGRVDGSLPTQLNNQMGEARTKELDQAIHNLRDALGCYADRRTFNPDRQ